MCCHSQGAGTLWWDWCNSWRCRGDESLFGEEQLSLQWASEETGGEELFHNQSHNFGHPAYISEYPILSRESESPKKKGCNKIKDRLQGVFTPFISFLFRWYFLLRHFKCTRILCIFNVLLFAACQLENSCCFTILKYSHHLVARSGYSRLAQLRRRTFHIIFWVF